MTRGWWGWTGWNGRSEAARADLSAEQGENGSQDDAPPDRLSAPRGRVSWICATPAGGKSAHETEQEAANRAAQSAGAVWYAATIEEDE